MVDFMLDRMQVTALMMVRAVALLLGACTPVIVLFGPKLLEIYRDQMDNSKYSTGDKNASLSLKSGPGPSVVNTRGPETVQTSGLEIRHKEKRRSNQGSAQQVSALSGLSDDGEPNHGNMNMDIEVVPDSELAGEDELVVIAADHVDLHNLPHAPWSKSDSNKTQIHHKSPRTLSSSSDVFEFRNTPPTVEKNVLIAPSPRSRSSKRLPSNSSETSFTHLKRIPFPSLESIAVEASEASQTSQPSPTKHKPTAIKSKRTASGTPGKVKVGAQYDLEHQSKRILESGSFNCKNSEVREKLSSTGVHGRVSTSQEEVAHLEVV
eukprot:gb/GEZN01010410.1/.p1 GENE.gb/GEZN01010410.1/~~gb/GEZN01010410.1/.p1  ORF type:complete len:356 (-),score=21.71 gb/GEZN01010410.1/:175-1137(-)